MQKTQQQRLKFLMNRYKNNTCSEQQYEELLNLFHEEGNMDMLDEILTQTWQQYAQPDLPEQTAIRVIMKRRWIAAASLFFVLAGAVTAYFIQSGNEKYTTYATAIGETKTIVLPDSSIVTLSPDSRLEWKNNWEEAGDRSATLDGESFFKVKKHKGKKFFVKTKDMHVEVLGTSFNVENRPGKAEVYLQEGKVRLTIGNNQGKDITMKPGEKVEYDHAKKIVRRSVAETVASSADSVSAILYFKNISFDKILKQLALLYNESFICDDAGLLNTNMYVGVPNKDWNTVKLALELSLGIRFEKEGESYVVTR